MKDELRDWTLHVYLVPQMRVVKGGRVVTHRSLRAYAIKRLDEDEFVGTYKVRSWCTYDARLKAVAAARVALAVRARLAER